MNPTRPSLPEGDFRFSLGLRRGSLDFFRHGPGDAELLAERRRWLAAEPGRFALCAPGGEPLLVEAGNFAAALCPGIPADAVADPGQLGAVWAPDFLLLSPDAAGRRVLRAGCVCFPSHWDLGEKMGLPLEAIHAPVPTLNAALSRQIDTFLNALRPGAVWERWNWGLTATPERNDHPALALPRLRAETPLDSIWLRFEQQALTQLPHTGAILFGIRIVLEPLPDFLRDPASRTRLMHLLKTMPADIADYKAITAIRPRLLAQFS